MMATKVKLAVFRIFYLFFMMVPLTLLFQWLFVLFLPELIATIISVGLAYFIADFVWAAHRIQSSPNKAEKQENEQPPKIDD